YLLQYGCVVLRPRSTLFPYTTLFRSAPYCQCIGIGTVDRRTRPRPGAGGPWIALVRAGRPAYKGFAGRFNCGVAKPRRQLPDTVDRKSTRLNSSHVKISYAVFCLKKI